MQVTAAPVSNSQEKVLSPALTANLGLILSPLKGVIISNSLLPEFKQLSDRSPKNAAVWSCLAWLYMLTDKPELALKAAQKAVKLDKVSPQNRINLVLAMLETKTAGVREHIELVQQLVSLNKEVRQEVDENIADGLARKPDWKSLERVKAWLNE